MTQKLQDLRIVAGSLDFEIAQLQKGRTGINAMEVIGNRATEASAVRQELVDLYGQIQLLNNARNLKQTELAKLNGTSEPTPVVIGDGEWAKDEGIEKLQAYASALIESLKALDELLAVHKAKAATPAPEANPTTENPAAEPNPGQES